MKHKFVTITEHSGAYEFSSSFVTKGDPKKILKGWRGDDSDNTDYGMEFEGGAILAEITEEKVIPEADYNVLKQYISEL